MTARASTRLSRMRPAATGMFGSSPESSDNGPGGYQERTIMTTREPLEPTPTGNPTPPAPTSCPPSGNFRAATFEQRTRPRWSGRVGTRLRVLFGKGPVPNAVCRLHTPLRVQSVLRHRQGGSPRGAGPDTAEVPSLPGSGSELPCEDRMCRACGGRGLHGLRPGPPSDVQGPHGGYGRGAILHQSYLEADAGRSRRGGRGGGAGQDARRIPGRRRGPAGSDLRPAEADVRHAFPGRVHELIPPRSQLRGRLESHFDPRGGALRADNRCHTPVWAHLADPYLAYLSALGTYDETLAHLDPCALPDPKEHPLSLEVHPNDCGGDGRPGVSLLGEDAVLRGKFQEVPLVLDVPP